MLTNVKKASTTTARQTPLAKILTARSCVNVRAASQGTASTALWVKKCSWITCRLKEKDNIFVHLHPEFFSPIFIQLQITAQNSTNLATKTKQAGSSQSVQATSRPLTFPATKPQQEGVGLSSRKDSTAPSTSFETGPTINKASVTWAASSGSGWTTSTDWQVRPTTSCELSWRTLKGTRLTQSTTRLLWQTKQTTTGWAWRATQVTSFRKLVLLLEWTSDLIQLFKRTGIRSYWQPWNAEWHNSIEWRNLPPEITFPTKKVFRVQLWWSTTYITIHS